MRKETYKLAAVLISLQLFMGFQCHREDIVFQHDFMEQVSLFPQQKSYHIGDTVWIQYVNTDNKFFDTRTNQRILADSLSIIFKASLNARFNTVINPPAGFCDFVTSPGVNSQTSQGAFGTSLYMTTGCNATNSYNFKIGIVFKERGIFSIDLSSKDIPVRCLNRVNSFPNSTLEYKLDFTDGNKDVFHSIPAASRGESPKGATERRIDDKKTFVLQVDL